MVDEFRAKTHHRVTENTEIAQRTPATAGEHEGEIKLTWKPVANARSYILEFSLDEAEATTARKRKQSGGALLFA